MNPNISMQTKRLSNFELLRVLAMLMVLALHADFKFLGCPTSADIAAAPQIRKRLWRGIEKCVCNKY